MSTLDTAPTKIAKKPPSRMLAILFLVFLVAASVGVGYLLGKQRNPAPIVIEKVVE